MASTLPQLLIFSSLHIAAFKARVGSGALQTYLLSEIVMGLRFFELGRASHFLDDLKRGRVELSEAARGPYHSKVALKFKQKSVRHNIGWLATLRGQI